MGKNVMLSGATVLLGELDKRICLYSSSVRRDSKTQIIAVLYVRLTIPVLIFFQIRDFSHTRTGNGRSKNCGSLRPLLNNVSLDELCRTCKS